MALRNNSRWEGFWVRDRWGDLKRGWTATKSPTNATVLEYLRAHQLSEACVSKLRSVKTVINFTNKDDSPLSVAHALKQVLKRYHPDTHQVKVVVYDWRWGSDSKKLELLELLFVDYDPTWQVRVWFDNPQRVGIKFTYPGLMWLMGV